MILKGKFSLITGSFHILARLTRTCTVPSTLEYMYLNSIELSTLASLLLEFKALMDQN